MILILLLFFLSSCIKNLFFLPPPHKIIFSSKINYKLIKNVIDWQLNHAKPRTAKTKQRNEVKGSTRKIVPQKGGGGARHASKKAPLFVGGGVAHGPKGAAYKIKKMKPERRETEPELPKRHPEIIKNR